MAIRVHLLQIRRSLGILIWLAVVGLTLACVLVYNALE
jgi:hypothetical protein